MNHPVRAPTVVCAGGAALLLAGALLVGLDRPLFWADEAETAMFAQRVLEYGYPKVHDDRNVVYQFGPNIAVGVKEGPDAYIGTTWGQFYFAVPGLAWAEGASDFAERTRRVRLPFALAGAAGLAFWLAALLPLFRGEPGRAWRFAALFLLLSALSVSLVLHLREVRYYALVVLLGGVLCREHLRYAIHAQSGFWRWSVAVTLLLVALFHVFFQAFFSFAALLGAERLWALLRGRGGRRELAPFVAAGVLVAPALVWFETFETAAAFRRSFAFGPADYLANLAIVGTHLRQHEFLAAALAARVVAQLAGAGSPAARQVAGGLLLFAAGTLAIGSLNPLPLERYFVVLSPVLLGAFLLDAFALVGLVRERSGRRAALGAAAVIAALALVSRAAGLPALEGRIAELSEPALGPVDFAVSYLAERYDRPEELVIATNYEEYAFMYYLGSRVIVGLSLNNLAREQGLEPDVVIPRRRWPRSLEALAPFVRGGDWEQVRLPVADVHHNNVPALSRSRFLPAPHRFATPATEDPDAQLVLYLRRSSAKTTGTSSRP